jgi:hypothetical protein
VVDLGTSGKLVGNPLSSSSSFSSISRSYSGLISRSGEEGMDVAGEVSPDKEVGRVNESPSTDGLFGEDEELDDVDVLMVVISGVVVY